jgi:hypothetical protein
LFISAVAVLPEQSVFSAIYLKIRMSKCDEILMDKTRLPYLSFAAGMNLLSVVVRQL